MMNMRTARRQWIRHGATSGSFFVDTSAHAQQLGLLPAASPYGDSKIGSLSPDDVAKHKALTAAGLSETEIKSMAAANLEAPATVPPPAAANGSSNGSNGASASALAAGINSPDRISAALTSADAEMQAHIAAQSLAVDVPSSSTAGRSRSGSRAGSATPGVVENGDADVSKQGLVKFLKDFEAVPIPADDMLWGLQEGDAVNRCVFVCGIGKKALLCSAVAQAMSLFAWAVGDDFACTHAQRHAAHCKRCSDQRSPLPHISTDRPAAVMLLMSLSCPLTTTSSSAWHRLSTRLTGHSCTGTQLGRGVCLSACMAKMIKGSVRLPACVAFLWLCLCCWAYATKRFSLCSGVVLSCAALCNAIAQVQPGS